MWTLFEANLNQLDPFFYLEDQLDPTQPEFTVENWVQPEKNGSGLAALLQDLYHNDFGHSIVLGLR